MMDDQVINRAIAEGVVFEVIKNPMISARKVHLIDRKQ